MLREEVIKEWKICKEKVLSWNKAKDRISQLQTRIKNKLALVQEKRDELRNLLRSDATDKKVWLEPTAINDPELEKRGKRMDELDIEISEEEKVIIELKENLNQLSITPLTVELERKLVWIKELVQQNRIAELKEKIETGSI